MNMNNSLKSTTLSAWGRFVLILCAVLGPATTRGDLIITKQDDGKTLTATVGQNISVELPGNPSTGFTWVQTETNGDAVVVLGPSTYTADNPGLAGGGGTLSFPLRAVKAGQTTLRYNYLQSWNPGSLADTFGVTVKVTDETAAPRLSAAVVEGKIVITWPAEGSSGYFIEGATSLAPSSWLAMNVAPILEGSNYVVTLGTGGQSLFFRLRKSP